MQTGQKEFYMSKHTFSQKETDLQVESPKETPRIGIGAVTPLDWLYKQIMCSRGTPEQISRRCGAPVGSFLEKQLVQLCELLEQTEPDW
jgi:hypothetical protein